jgi:hypothetical protein
VERVNLYRSRDWTCACTGKTGLTYEEAALSEARSADGCVRVRIARGAGLAPRAARVVVMRPRALLCAGSRARAAAAAAARIRRRRAAHGGAAAACGACAAHGRAAAAALRRAFRSRTTAGARAP